MEDHFLHQFQSIVFSNKLAEGTATEKADILRRALMELKNANTNKLYDCCNFIYLRQGIPHQPVTGLAHLIAFFLAILFSKMKMSK